MQPVEYGQSDLFWYIKLLLFHHLSGCRDNFQEL